MNNKIYTSIMILISRGFQNFFSNILFTISGLSFFILLFLTIFQFKSLAILSGLLVLSVCFIDVSLKRYKNSISSNMLIISAILLFLVLPDFYETYIHSSIFMTLADKIHVSVNIFVFFIATALFIFSLYFASYIVMLIYIECDVAYEINCLKNKLKNIENIKKSYIYINIIYLLSIFTIIRANVLYADDMRRVYDGNPLWTNFFRYISNFLSRFINTSNYLTDISPLTQLIAIVFISLASLILIIVFRKTRNISWWDICSVLVVGLSPYFLECLSYKFDAPFMALSVLCAVIPLLFIDSSKKFYVMIVFITTLIITMTYQASLGIFPFCIVFILMRKWIFKENYKEIFRLFIYSISSYVIAILIFKFFLSNNLIAGEDTYITSTMWPLKEFPTGVFKNIKEYMSLIISDYDLKWLICILIICCFFPYTMVKKSKQSKLITAILSIIVLVITFVLTYGIYVVLITPLFQPRAFYGFGVWTAVLGLICLTENKNILKLVVLYFNLCFVVFSFTYGNVLAEQDRYVNFRINMVYSQLNNLEQLDFSKLKRMKIEGDIGDSPIIEKIQRSGNALNRINRLGFSGRDYLWDKFYFQHYFDFPKLEYDENLDYRNLPLISEGYYNKIYGNDESIVIYLNNF